MNCLFLQYLKKIDVNVHYNLFTTVLLFLKIINGIRSVNLVGYLHLVSKSKK